MSEIIRVKILEDGVSCREVNEIERPEMGRDKEYSFTDISTDSIIYHQRWHERLAQYNEAKSKLRTFKIETLSCHNCQGGGCTVCGGFGYMYVLFPVGSIHQAEVIEKDKVRII